MNAHPTLLAACSAVLIAMTLYYFLIVRSRRGRVKDGYGQCGHERAAEKYSRIEFDRERGEFIVEKDLYLTDKNGCPVRFKSLDGESLEMNVYLSYVSLEESWRRNSSDRDLENELRLLFTAIAQEIGCSYPAHELKIAGRTLTTAIRTRFSKEAKDIILSIRDVILIGTIHPAHAIEKE